MFWGLIFPMQDPWAGKPEVGLSLFLRRTSAIIIILLLVGCPPGAMGVTIPCLFLLPTNQPSLILVQISKEDMMSLLGRLFMSCDTIGFWYPAYGFPHLYVRHLLLSLIGLSCGSEVPLYGESSHYFLD